MIRVGRFLLAWVVDWFGAVANPALEIDELSINLIPDRGGGTLDKTRKKEI